MRRTNVRSHKRRNGATVRSHSRKISQIEARTQSFNKDDYYQDKKFFGKKKGVFSLPIETAVLVPATTDADKKITAKQFSSRIYKVKKYMASTYGGFSSVNVEGGYYSSDKNKVIEEPIVKVVGFSTKEDWEKNKSRLFKKIKSWGRSWKQESIGVEHEGDLFYVDSR